MLTLSGYGNLRQGGRHVHDQDPYRFLAYIFGVTSFAGLAAILRSGQKLTMRSVLSAVLNSGLFGVGIATLWMHLYPDLQHPWFVVGVSLFAGLGGVSLMDFLYQACQNGFNIYVTRIAQGAALPVPSAPQTQIQYQQPIYPQQQFPPPANPAGPQQPFPMAPLPVPPGPLPTVPSVLPQLPTLPTLPGARSAADPFKPS